MAVLSAIGMKAPAAVLALAVSLLLGACAPAGAGKTDDPAFFGGASGSNGGAGGTSGMSINW
jgi:hypothetical protein